MNYYKYDEEKLEEIKSINEKITKDQQEIFDILLRISQSFSDDKYSKEKRNELFNQVDLLKQNIKEYTEQIKEIKSRQDNNIIKSDKEKQDLIENKKIVDVDKTEKKNMEFIDAAQKLEDTLKESKINDEDVVISKRKKARTQLVVVEDDNSMAGKVKQLFNKLRRIIKK